MMLKNPGTGGEHSLVERMRGRSGGRGSRYWQYVLGLGVVGALVLFFLPGKGVRVVLPQPGLPQPDYRVREARDMPASRVDRITVVAVVRPGFADDSLRNALDWLLYSTLDESNRQKKRRVRVVWAYVVEHETTATANWRAMAIWHDPSLPEALKPAGPGGDVVKSGSVQYDFTNPAGVGRGTQ